MGRNAFSFSFTSTPSRSNSTLLFLSHSSLSPYPSLSTISRSFSLSVCLTAPEPKRAQILKMRLLRFLAPFLLPALIGASSIAATGELSTRRHDAIVRARSSGNDLLLDRDLEARQQIPQGQCALPGQNGLPSVGCGSKPGKCNENTCDGTSLPGAPLGICTNSFPGCTCLSVCGGSPGACNLKNGCNGVNSPTGGLGMCQGGILNGCTCTSVCGSSVNSCSINGCNGAPNSNGVKTCTTGDFNGCLCQ